MRHRKQTVILDRAVGPRQLLLRNLVRSVLLHERVETTLAKARAVRPLLERCVTIGKSSTLTARRQLLALLNDERVVAKVLEVFGPRYAQRLGGYTRTTQVGRRQGDGASMAVIEFV